MNLHNLRQEYAGHSLDEKSVNADPYTQFKTWFDEAVKASVNEPNAMILSTVNAEGGASARTVLLKEVRDHGFVFFTNYESQKGKDIEAHPKVSLLFFWPELFRQIRIEGVTTRISKEDSEKYFQSRPKDNQIGAWASPQSEIIVNRDVLETKMDELAAQYADQDVLPLPPYWGGYLVNPTRIEFWQGRPGRVHDRILYTYNSGNWSINRLAP